MELSDLKSPFGAARSAHVATSEAALGKEGICSSSPEEGFASSPLISSSRLLKRRAGASLKRRAGASVHHAPELAAPVCARIARAMGSQSARSTP
jgi:hypothetical protein